MLSLIRRSNPDLTAPRFGGRRWTCTSTTRRSGGGGGISSVCYCYIRRPKLAAARRVALRFPVGETGELLLFDAAEIIGRRDRICTCTGFRPRVSETRVYTFHHSPKKLVRPGRLARPRAGAAQRFLGPPGLLFHARPPDGSRRPDSHRHGPSRPAGFESAVSTFQPRRDRLVRTEGVAPSRACAHRILAPARLLFRHVRRKTGSGTEICAPLFPIPTGCVAAYALPAIVVEAEGLAPSGARGGGAFTARCNCCSATLRKDWGLERDSHPRPSPYEGAALPAAPSSRNGGPPR